MPAYTPNPFAGGATPSALATQGAQVQALRGYAPNQFAGTSVPNWNTGQQAAHLSTPAAQRPFAEDISLIQNSGALKQPLPDFDKQWRYSPQSYEKKVGTLLEGNYPYGAILADERDKKLLGTTREIFDDNGMPITQTYGGYGEWNSPRRKQGEGD